MVRISWGFNKRGDEAISIEKIKSLEAALREARERFRSVFDNPAVGMIIFSPEGCFLEANGYIRRMLGYSREELRTKHFKEVTHPEDVALSLNTDKDILEGKIPFAWFEKRYIGRDGSVIWVILSSSLVRDEKGEPRYFISHVQNITQRKEAEEEVRAQAGVLKQQAEHLHEVNTALKVLLDHRDQERRQLEKDILAGLEKLVRPYLERLAAGHLSSEQQTLAEIALDNLGQVAGPFAVSLSGPESRLSPAELEVADLLRHGKTTQEMAELLSVSPTTIAFHRRNIRSKLDLTGKRVNLKVHLRSLT